MAKILIVDDEAPIRDLLLTIVQRLGHEGMGAGSAAEALSLVHAFHFDLAFVDLVMPGIGGLTLIMESLRSIPGLSIIAMSGRIPLDGESVTSFSHSFGVACMLPKPFGLEEVRAILEKALVGACGGS